MTEGTPAMVNFPSAGLYKKGPAYSYAEPGGTL